VKRKDLNRAVVAAIEAAFEEDQQPRRRRLKGFRAVAIGAALAAGARVAASKAPVLPRLAASRVPDLVRDRLTERGWLGGEEPEDEEFDEEPEAEADEEPEAEADEEAYADEDEEPAARRRRPRDRRDGGPPRGGAGRIIRAAREQVQELLGRRVTGVIGFDRIEGGWEVTVEVLELERVPETTSILGCYAVQLDQDGQLEGYHRVRRYARSQIDQD
jgi:Gas vesicle synthesis protein GvpO